MAKVKSMSVSVLVSSFDVFLLCFAASRPVQLQNCKQDVGRAKRRTILSVPVVPQGHVLGVESYYNKRRDNHQRQGLRHVRHRPQVVTGVFEVGGDARGRNPSSDDFRSVRAHDCEVRRRNHGCRPFFLRSLFLVSCRLGPLLLLAVLMQNPYVISLSFLYVFVSLPPRFLCR